MLDLAQGYLDKLKIDQNDVSCLLFALQIPSICSRIEFPQTSENTGKCEDGKFYRSNGKTWDANMYKAWLEKHHSYFEDIYSYSMTIETFCNSLYELRNQVTHEGVLMSDKNKFYFIESNNAMIIGNTVFIPIKRLCKDMLYAAYDMLLNRHESINITLFNDMLVSSEIYSQILNDASEIYRQFWCDYAEDDQTLYRIYKSVTSNNPNMCEGIDKFFAESPDAVFEIWDFSDKYGLIDMDERFVHKDYNESKLTICQKLKINTDVLRLTKQQYERMLNVVNEHSDYTKQHPFDITKYIDEG